MPYYASCPCLEADSFINGFVRFCARRGVPEKVRSDNGTNFVAGEKELREAMRSWNNDGKVKAHLLQKEIKWEFNPLQPLIWEAYGKGK